MLLHNISSDSIMDDIQESYYSKLNVKNLDSLFYVKFIINITNKLNNYLLILYLYNYI